jgi:hypothetical protein
MTVLPSALPSSGWTPAVPTADLIAGAAEPLPADVHGTARARSVPRSRESLPGRRRGCTVLAVAACLSLLAPFPLSGQVSQRKLNGPLVGDVVSFLPSPVGDWTQAKVLRTPAVTTLILEAVIGE